MHVAVIGTGIAGLGAAYVLSRAHEVTLFERNDYAGGHTNTVTVSRHGQSLALDTGFIVHNEPNYPNLVRLFRELGVRTQGSEMSFSVSCARCGIEYSGRRPLADPRNLLRPGFARMLRDVARFLRTARGLADDARYAEATLADLAARERYSREFRDHFLVPLTSAIWSTAPQRALDFPAAYAIRFFDNHGMLGWRRHEWRTVVGGSREYVRAVLERSGARLQLSAPVMALRRDAAGVEVTTADGHAHRFDRAVVATHGDEALALLADPTGAERRILGTFATTRNETVLHTDERLLPRSRSAWASWNFHVEDCTRCDAVRPTITYHLNRLQRLAGLEQYCVTLNRGGEIGEDHVIERLVYDHPLYTVESLRAQAELPTLNTGTTVYCGAYHGFGFHEDGLRSGLAAAQAIGVRW